MMTYLSLEARPSKRNQGTDSRNRTIYMEKQRMTKEFVEGLQQATSSQTKDNPNSEVSFTTHGEKEIDTVKLRNLNDNPVFEARNIRGENEESNTRYRRKSNQVRRASIPLSF